MSYSITILHVNKAKRLLKSIINSVDGFPPHL